MRHSAVKKGQHRESHHDTGRMSGTRGKTQDICDVTG